MMVQQKTICIILTLFSIHVLFHSNSFSDTIRVPQDFITIQGALDNVTTGDTVLVACGTYYEHNILMTSGACLRSETGDPQCVIIDAQEQRGGILCTGVDNTTRIEGVTITHGVFDERGKAADIFCEDGAAPVIQRCNIVVNAGDGIGVGLTGTAPSSPTIRDCIIAYNSWIIAKGVACGAYSDITIIGCTIVRNGAEGIRLTSNSTAVIQNSIIVFNDDWGVSCDDSSEALLMCCDVFGNTGGDWGGCLSDQPGLNGNIAVDPSFCDIDGYDLGLLPDSPCIEGNHPAGAACSLIGALSEGCGVIGIESISWGKIKE
ncbi:MAG: right-handed parallel beta-helix repeat-containing protein [bacterium]|nr:MAG: right-handed parallel beta-helix repeat-containing protein [bacterium]